MRISDWSSDVCSSDLLGANVRAVHDGVAAIEAERVLKLIQPFARHFVTAVGQPAIGLQQDRRAEEAVGVPPIAGAGCGTTGAQDALVPSVQLGAILRRPQPFLARRRRRARLLPWLAQRQLA